MSGKTQINRAGKNFGAIGVGDGPAGEKLYAEEMATAPVDCSSSDVHEPAANTAAVVTYAAAASTKHVIFGVAWSYDADPTGGSLTITDAGSDVFKVDITSKGPGVFKFPRPKRSAAANTAMVVTLAAGGADVSGVVSVLNHWTEPA
jgi:hypothetical protein